MTPEELKARRDQRVAAVRERNARIAEITAHSRQMYADFKASEFARYTFKAGDVTINRFTQGTLSVREARGPSQQAVEDAFEYFLRNHPCNRPYYMAPARKNSNDQFVVSRSEPSAGPSGVWKLNWTHWTENLS